MMDAEYEITDVCILQGWGKYDAPGAKGFILRWSAKNIGFGCLTFRQQPDGRLVCETEYMGPDFVMAVMKKFSESLTLEHK